MCYPTRSRQFGGGYIGYVGSGLRYHYSLLTDETCNPWWAYKIQLPVHRSFSAGSLVNTCHFLSRYTRAWMCRPRAVVGRQRLSLRSSRQRARKLHKYRQRGEGMGQPYVARRAAAVRRRGRVTDCMGTDDDRPGTATTVRALRDDAGPQNDAGG